MFAMINIPVNARLSSESMNRLLLGKHYLYASSVYVCGRVFVSHYYTYIMVKFYVGMVCIAFN